MDWTILISGASPVVAAIALYFTIRNHNANQFRIKEVAEWGDRCIEVLQTFAIVTASYAATAGEKRVKVEEIIHDLGTRASVLVEQGRMYFRNAPDDDGTNLWKHEAYRGTRPEILDQLVIAFAISREWQGSDAARLAQLVALAVRAEQRFVTLIQMEVGRSKVSSHIAGKAGQTVVLDELIASVEALEVRNARVRFSDVSL
jgi:hypothetical protein